MPSRSRARKSSLPSDIPDGEGELAVEIAQAGRAVLFVEVQDDLGVGVRGEPMAARFQLGPQLDVVEDLAVEDDPERAVPQSPLLIG